MLATGPGSLRTPWGRFGLDPSATYVLGQTTLTATGTHELVFPVRPGHSGLTLHAQGLVLNAAGRLSRTDVMVLP